MKKSEMRSALERLNQRLDNQWAYARSDAEMDIAAGRAEYNDDGERLPTEPEIYLDGRCTLSSNFSIFFFSSSKVLSSDIECLYYLTAPSKARAIHKVR